MYACVWVLSTYLFYKKEILVTWYDACRNNANKKDKNKILFGLN